MHTLSLLKHGTLDEKLTWIFSLYDVNKDGEVCRADLEEITTSVITIISDEFHVKSSLLDISDHDEQG